MRVRVVGGPQELGRWLADKFNTVDYLGTLDDAALAVEAATGMSSFIHLRLPRAAALLAIGIAWQIPIVTTAEGGGAICGTMAPCRKHATPTTSSGFAGPCWTPWRRKKLSARSPVRPQLAFGGAGGRHDVRAAGVSA